MVCLFSSALLVSPYLYPDGFKPTSTSSRFANSPVRFYRLPVHQGELTYLFLWKKNNGMASSQWGAHGLNAKTTHTTKKRTSRLSGCSSSKSQQDDCPVLALKTLSQNLKGLWDIALILLKSYASQGFNTYYFLQTTTITIPAFRSGYCNQFYSKLTIINVLQSDPWLKILPKYKQRITSQSNSQVLKSQVKQKETNPFRCTMTTPGLLSFPGWAPLLSWPLCPCHWLAYTRPCSCRAWCPPPRCHPEGKFCMGETQEKGKKKKRYK